MQHPGPASNAWSLACSKNQQGCGHVKSILGDCVCTANMTAHKGFDQRQYTQCLGGWPELEVPPGLKKKKGRSGGGLLFPNVFLQKASSLGYSSELGMEMLRSDNI